METTKTSHFMASQEQISMQHKTQSKRPTMRLSNGEESRKMDKWNTGRIDRTS